MQLRADVGLFYLTSYLYIQLLCKYCYTHMLIFAEGGKTGVPGEKTLVIW